MSYWLHRGTPEINAVGVDAVRCINEGDMYGAGLRGQVCVQGGGEGRKGMSPGRRSGGGVGKRTTCRQSRRPRGEGRPSAPSPPPGTPPEEARGRPMDMERRQKCRSSLLTSNIILSSAYLLSSWRPDTHSGREGDAKGTRKTERKRKKERKEKCTHLYNLKADLTLEKKSYEPLLRLSFELICKLEKRERKKK